MIVFIILIIIILIIVAVVRHNEKEAEINVLRENKVLEFIEKNNVQQSRRIDFIVRSPAIFNSIIIDETSKMLHLFHSGQITSHNFFEDSISFDKLLGVEIIENKEVSGGIKRAIIGGALAGPEGAIVGSNTARQKVQSIELIIYQSSILKPQITLSLFNTLLVMDTKIYEAKNFCKEVNAVVKAIMDQS